MYNVMYIICYLFADKHKFFGAVLESRVIFILDASSSMSVHWPEVKSGLKRLLCDFPAHIKRYIYNV